MTDDWLDQLEAGLVRLQDGYCVASDLEVAAAAAIQKLRAELAAERENNKSLNKHLTRARGNTQKMKAERDELRAEADTMHMAAAKLRAERDALRALLRETRIIVADEDRPRMDASELVARIDAALKGDDRE